MSDFFDEVFQQCLSSDLDRETCKDQAAAVECLCLDSLFGVEDFTDEFRKNFGISDDEHTECFQTVIDFEKAKANGNLTDLIAIEESKWRQVCDFHFGSRSNIGDDETDGNDLIEDEETNNSAMAVYATLSTLFITFLLSTL